MCTSTYVRNIQVLFDFKHDAMMWHRWNGICFVFLCKMSKQIFSLLLFHKYRLYSQKKKKNALQEVYKVLIGLRTNFLTSVAEKLFWNFKILKTFHLFLYFSMMSHVLHALNPTFMLILGYICFYSHWSINLWFEVENIKRKSKANWYKQIGVNSFMFRCWHYGSTFYRNICRLWR